MSTKRALSDVYELAAELARLLARDMARAEHRRRIDGNSDEGQEK